jgi:hypothetical protein
VFLAAAVFEVFAALWIACMAWEVQVTSPLTTADSHYRLTGTALSGGAAPEGASIRVRSLATGWTEEAFLDARGGFFQDLELAPVAECGSDYELTVCDEQGREAACVTIRILHANKDAAACDQEPADHQTAAGCASSLDPPWPVCTQRIRHCLHLAAAVAQATGRNRDELLQYVHAQERYAEQARKENNRALYRECLDNLEKYAAYLEQIEEAAQPKPLHLAPRVVEEVARETMDRLRNCLATVWKEARSRQRADLELGLKQVAAQAQGLGQRCKVDAASATEEASRLLAELETIQQQVSVTGGSGSRPESIAGPTPAADFLGTDGAKPLIDDDPR